MRGPLHEVKLTSREGEEEEDDASHGVLRRSLDANGGGSAHR